MGWSHEEKREFVLMLREAEGWMPARHDSYHPKNPGKVVLVESDAAKSLDLFDAMLAQQIAAEQQGFCDITAGKIVVMEINEDGIIERWPISIEDAMNNIFQERDARNVTETT